MSYRAQILKITGSSTQRIFLRTIDFDFTAGQYLQVVHPNGTHVPLSIASSPSQLPELELHYRSTAGNADAVAMDEMLLGHTLEISEAAGRVICPEPHDPLIIIVGGSGVASAFSLTEHRSDQLAASPIGPTKSGPASSGPARSLVVWCADRDEDIYELDRLRRAADEVHVFIDDRRTDANKGMRWITNHASDFNHASVIIQGSPPFVYAITDTLLARGLQQSQLQSDVYEYAPR